ncbi:CD276 antigen-like, partial [Acipenser oxyrinchus oxyrinchus]
AAAAVTGVLAILILAAGRVSGSDLVQVQSSMNCTQGQDCILSCTFNDTAGGWDEKSGVIWRRTETDHIVHRIRNNTDQLADQSPQYVSRTSLFDSEVQRGNASLLLMRVTEEDAGEYGCSVYTPGGSARVEVQVPSSVNCVVGQDCVLSCTFNFTSDMKDLAVTWTLVKKKEYTIHSYYDNRDQLANQSPQYVSRTSLFDSELQRGNASLLLRRVREEDAGEYRCHMNSRMRYGMSSELVLFPAEPTTAAGPDKPTPPPPPAVNGRQRWGFRIRLLVFLGLFLFKGCAAERGSFCRVSRCADEESRKCPIDGSTSSVSDDYTS